MSLLKYVSGYQHGGLTLIRLKEGSSTSWVAECTCGDEVEISVSSIYRGAKTSCRSCEQLSGSKEKLLKEDTTYLFPGDILNKAIKSLTKKDKLEALKLLHEHGIEWKKIGEEDVEEQESEGKG